MTLTRSADRLEPLMIRRLLIFTLTLLVAGNSLAAAAIAAVECDSGCGTCCATRRMAPQVSPSKVRCLTECNQHGESQPSPAASLNRTQRHDQSPSPVNVGSASSYSTQPSGSLLAPPRTIAQSTHLYLRIGILLI